jgi:hypothetical protein
MSDEEGIDTSITYFEAVEFYPKQNFGEIADAVAGMALERLQERIREIVRIEVAAEVARKTQQETEPDSKN